DEQVVMTAGDLPSHGQPLTECRNSFLAKWHDPRFASLALLHQQRSALQVHGGDSQVQQLLASQAAVDQDGQEGTVPHAAEVGSLSLDRSQKTLEIVIGQQPTSRCIQL